MADDDNNSSSKGTKGGGGKKDGADGSREQPDKKQHVARRKDGRLYIEKNSLSEQQLLAAREESRLKLERITQLGEATEQDIHEDRRAANRLSAFQSRKRRKGNVETLKERVAELTAEHMEQAETIDEQESQLKAMMEENKRLRGKIKAGGGGEDDISADGDVAAVAAASGADSSTNDRKQPAQQQPASVTDMIQTLKDLSKKQTGETKQQTINQAASRKELKDSQDREQQSLLTVQGKETDQMAQSQLQDRNKLATAQNAQLNQTMTDFGFRGDANKAEALNLFKELGDVQVATTQATAVAEGMIANAQQQAQAQQQEQEEQQEAEDNAAEALNQLRDAPKGNPKKDNSAS